MELKVYRKIYSKNSTIGELYVDGRFFCYTLEDYCRDVNRDGDLNDSGEKKVFGKTAIPAGRYAVVLSFSSRFKKYMPEVLGVAGFSGVRIHSGNTAADTEGCLLLGTTKARDFVGNSRIAFETLMSRLKVIEREEKIFIQYIDQPQEHAAA